MKTSNKFLNYDIESKTFHGEWNIKYNKVNTCVIYARVSTVKQISEWSWIDTQRQACEKRAKDNWIAVVKYFEDKAVSWAKLTRPWLDAAIEYLKAENKKEKRIGYFVCTELSRISRAEDVVDSYMKIDEIEDTWVEIKTVNSVRRTETAEDEFLNDINMARAKYERKQINKRCHQWQIEKARRWDWPFNNVPVGYLKQWIWKKSTVVIDEDKAKIVAEWLKLFADDVIKMKTDLLDYWNERWLKTNWVTCKKLYLSFIEKQLQFCRLFFYAWLIIYPERGIDEPIKWNWDAIISEETLERLIVKIQINEKTWWTRKRDKEITENFILKWLLVCPNCGKKLTWYLSKSHTWKYYPYYWCTNKSCTNRPNIPQKEIESSFENLLKNLKIPENVINYFNDKVKEQRWELTIADTQDKELQKKEMAIKARMSELEMAMTKNVNSAVVDKRNLEWTELNAELNKISEEKINKIYTVENLLPLLDRTSEIIANPLDVWQNSSKEIKQVLTGVRFDSKILYEKKSDYRTLGTWLLNWCFDITQGTNFQWYPERDLNPHGLAATRFWV